MRFAGMDVTVYSSDGERSPGHLSRQGSPDYAYYQRLAARPDNGKNPTLAVERKILRRSYHTLRELGDAALAMPVPEAKGVAA